MKIYGVLGVIHLHFRTFATHKKTSERPGGSLLEHGAHGAKFL